mgnify:CR=1 FL=1
MQNDRIKYILGAIVFAFSIVLYLMTVAPTVSFWDCGEFIACSYILGVPHPPGSPLFILMGRFFSLLPTGVDPAFRVNIMSPLAAAFANLLAFLILVKLVKVWRGGLDTSADKVIAYSGALIGALAFAATDSHWFNSAEAEVYAISTFATALVVWLALVWAERSEESGSGRYLLLIAYILGVSIGVHLLNLLALPVIALIIYFRKYEFKWSTFALTAAITLGAFLIIYLGIIKGLPKVANITYAGGYFGFYLIAILVIALFAVAWWSIKERKQVVALGLISAVLIVVGYSSYAMIYIRANQDPAINENDPSSPARLVSYLEREQYGQHSILDRESVWEESQKDPGAYIAPQTDSALEFVWDYQVKYMYGRYFAWQFVGKDEPGVDISQFYLLPLLLGLFGMWYHFQRDPRRGLVVLALFIMTGLAVVAYLNQPDPQPRERDYSYVGSFLAFSLWVGIGASGLIELIYENMKGAVRKYVALGVSILLFFAIPVQMLAKNYHTHDRSGNYVAWDYSYNILQSIEPNGIVFTNGDNDTFPLWYLQEVEGIRKDVKVVNLSLLNTHWYIKQLRDYSPSILPQSFTDDRIEQLYPMRFEEQTVEISAPRSEQNPDGKIRFKMKPTYGGQGIRVQDIMILRILEENLNERPVYFAITVASQNKINLDQYLRMDGLTLKVMPYKVGNTVAPEILRTNLLEEFKYRNLGDPEVYFNDNIRNLLQNYRSTFMQLAIYHYQQGDTTKTLETLNAMSESIPEETIPFTNRDIFLEIGRIYAKAGQPDVLGERLNEVLENPNLNMRRRLAYTSLYITQLEDYATADSILSGMYQQNPGNGQLIGMLLRVYEEQERWQEAYDLVSEWVSQNPQDQQARQMLKRYQRRLEQVDTTSVQ